MAKRPEKPVVKTDNAKQSAPLWRDTGQVFYLENTLKLSYQSNSGLVTLENLSVKDLPQVIRQVNDIASSSPLARSTTANQTSAFNISLCAVTWQQNGDSVRIKAIPQAAILRSQTSCFSRSQAVFRHEFLLEHDDLLTPSLSHQKSGVFTYNRVSIDEFTQQIAQSNARLSGTLRRSISVKAENFNTAFSSHETEQVEKLLNSPMHEQRVDKKHLEG